VVVERSGSTSGSQSSVNFNVSDEEFEGETREGGLVRFSSSSSPGSSMLCDFAADEFFNLQFEYPTSSDSFDSSIDFVAEPLAMPSNQFLSIPEINVSSFCEGVLLQNREKPTLHRRSLVPRPPGSPRDQSVQFFLHFHRQSIMESHYCLFFDYRKFITTTLLAMAERSSALRHAVVAFSALIYSIKGDHIAREQAFENYEISIQQLRVLLDKVPMTVEERQAATVTALELASFDVITLCTSTNISDSPATQPTVFDICGVQHTSCKNSRILFNTVPPQSTDRSSNGSAMSKIIVAFSGHIKHSSQLNTGAKT